jgi:hypothetical protein
MWLLELFFSMQSLLLIFVLYLFHMLPFCMQEDGHFLAAFPKNVKLGIPFFIPNFILGTFGAITLLETELLLSSRGRMTLGVGTIF